MSDSGRVGLRPARSLRAGLFTGATVGLATAAHAVGGGEVSVTVAFAAVAVLSLVAYRLAGHRRGPVAIGAAMALTQVVLHEAFTLWTSATCLDSGGTGHHASAVHCAPVGHPSMSPSPGMTAAHVVAAAVLTGLLVHGERVLWRLAAGWRVAVAVVRGVVVLLASSRVPVLRALAPRRVEVGRSAHPWRGPPASPAAA